MRNNRFFEWIKRQYEHYPLAFQGPGWLLYTVVPYLLIPLPPWLSTSQQIKLMGIKLLNEGVCIAFFYVNYRFLTPDTLRQYRPYRLGGALLGMISLLVVLNVICFRLLLHVDNAIPLSSRGEPPVSLLQSNYWLSTPMPLIITSLLSLLLLTGMSSGLAIYQDRQRQEGHHQQMLIEKKEAELTALKLQISPHFLFNTLNNLRWMARQQSTQTEGAILRLAEMLRYMLYQADRGPVPLAREIDYLTDYIELQQLRLAPHNQVLFEREPVADHVLIEPLLLIHFVENVFKHGLHHDQASTVTIRLELKQKSLFFSTRNRLHTTESLESPTDSGIGIQNVGRRLALHYPDRHNLRIYRLNGQFCVDLRIDLAFSMYETSQYSH